MENSDTKTSSPPAITMMEFSIYKMIELTPNWFKSDFITFFYHHHIDNKCLGTTKKKEKCKTNTSKFLCRYHTNQYSFIILNLLKMSDAYYDFIKLLSWNYRSFEFFYENLLVVNSEKKECVVCYETTEKYFKVSCCGNVYCKQCITSWSKLNNSCPMCRKQIISTTS